MTLPLGWMRTSERMSCVLYLTAVRFVACCLLCENDSLLVGKGLCAK